MKKTILTAAFAFLALQTAYTSQNETNHGKGVFAKIRLSSTRLPRMETEKEFFEEFNYHWQTKRPATQRKSTRSTAERTPYLNLLSLLKTNPNVPLEQQYSVRFSHEDENKILSLYRAGKLQLSWTQGAINFQQYCVHPQDGFHTLAITSPKGTIYYKQQRYTEEVGTSPVVDVFTDSKHQLEYWFDSEIKKWVIEGRENQIEYSSRKKAIRHLKQLSARYTLEDKTDDIVSLAPYNFTDPYTRWIMDEEEKAQFETQSPPLWKSLSIGWLALTSGGILETLRYGITKSSSNSQLDIEIEENSNQGYLAQSTPSYSINLSQFLNQTPYIITPLIVSLFSSRKAGFSHSGGILGGLGLSFGIVTTQSIAPISAALSYAPDENEAKSRNDAETIITTFRDLDSYLNGKNPVKLGQVKLMFEPNNIQLEGLLKIGYSSIFVPTLTEKKIETAKSLLSHQNVFILFAQLTNKHNLLSNWTLEEIKQLWDSVEDQTDPLEGQQNFKRTKITKSLASYRHSVSLNQLQATLKEFPFLTNIMVKDVTPKNISTFINFMAGSTRITSSSLSNNKLGAVEAKAQQNFKRTKITKSLANYRHSVSLNQLQATLKEFPFLTNIMVKDVTPENISTFINFMAGNTNITSLSLWFNKLGAAGAKAVVEVLRDNTALKSLDLTCNSIGDAGITSLAEMLESNDTLTSLYLIGNGIGDAGREALQRLKVLRPKLEIDVLSE